MPLALLEKNLHLDFDAQSNSGNSLQLLTSDQNSEYARSLILAFLRANGCSKALIESVSPAIWELAGPHLSSVRDQNTAWMQLQSLVTPGEVSQLAQVQDFPELLDTFFNYYLAIVRIEDPGTATTTVKYRFIEDGGEWAPTVGERLGLVFPAMTISSQLGYARSDHKIIETPAGLVTDEVLTVVNEPKENTYVPLKLIDAIYFRDRISPRQFVLNAKSPYRTSVKSVLRMTPGLGEFHLPALLSLSFTLVLLSLGLLAELFWQRLSNLDEVSAIVTILALVPSILNVYLALPGEHPVVARLFALPRTLVFCASAITVLVAGAIALKLGHPTLVMAFAVAGSYSFLVWLLIVSTVVRMKWHQRQHSGSSRNQFT